MAASITVRRAAGSSGGPRLINDPGLDALAIPLAVYLDEWPNDQRVAWSIGLGDAVLSGV